MNKFYKVVFCKTTGVMKAVSETAKSGKKTKSVSVVATALAVGLMSATSANAAIEDDVAANTAIIGQHTQALEQINGALEEVGQLSQNITQAGLIVGTADINEGSMAVGAEAVASGDSAIAVGNQANVKGVQGLAVGSYNDVTGRQSTAIGSNNTIRGIEEWWNDEVFTQESQRSTLIGVENNLTGSESIAIGVYNRANNDNVTITGTRNNVDARKSGAYGQDNFVGSERVVPTFLRVDDGAALRRVDDGAALRMLPSYAIQSGSYAYGNGNEVVGNKTHAVGNSNNVMGEGNGVLGNGNTLSNDSGFIEPPRWDVRTANMERGLDQDSNGSFLVGNQNEVTANNTHAVGNQNTIRNDRNVTIGNSNRVDFLEEPIFTQPQRMSLNNDTSTAIVGEEPVFIQPQRIGMIGNNNTSTAIVGEGNEIYAAGVHIVGTENSIDQAYSYVVGAGNQVDSDNGLMFGPGSIGDGSAIMGSDNYIKSQGTAVLGSNNSVYSDSPFSVVSGSRNEVDGLFSSVVGANNYTEKDVGGTFGTFNKVTGNYGILELIENAMQEAQESEGGFQGIDTNGDGVIDIATLEELEAFQVSIIGNGSYAYGNGNIVEGEGAHVTGNTNEVAGDNSGAFGNKNIIGTPSSYNEETEETEDTIAAVKANNSFAYGNNNTILASDNSVLGNDNTSDANGAIIVGSGNTVNIDAADSIILGSNASSTVAGGIAIGNNSVADRENALSVGSAGAERQITNVADGTQDKDAVNLGQLNASIRDTTGGKNITATRTDTGYEVALNDAITLDSVTTGNTVVNTDGVKAGDVSLSSSTGLDNAGNRVTSVGDATLRSDAVNYGQFQDGLAGTIKSVTGDENITATTDAEKNVSLVLNKDLVADSLTAGDTVINNAGFTNGATTVGNTGLQVGDVTVASTGLDNAGNRVTSVGDAIADTDAVNYGQFKAGLTDTTAGKNISVKRTDTGYEVSTVEDMSLTSVTTGDTVINNAGFTNGATTVGNTGLRVGDVTVASTGLDNAGNRVTSVGDATLRSDAVNYGQFQDGMAGTIKSVTGDENITATTDAEKNVSLVLNKNLVADSLTTGTTIINTDGVRAGDVFMSSTSGLNNAGFTVSGVGDAVERDEAINKGQFDDATKDIDHLC